MNLALDDQETQYQPIVKRAAAAAGMTPKAYVAAARREQAKLDRQNIADDRAAKRGMRPHQFGRYIARKYGARIAPHVLREYVSPIHAPVPVMLQQTWMRARPRAARRVRAASSTPSSTGSGDTGPPPPSSAPGLSATVDACFGTLGGGAS